MCCRSTPRFPAGTPAEVCAEASTPGSGMCRHLRSAPPWNRWRFPHRIGWTDSIRAGSGIKGHSAPSARSGEEGKRGGGCRPKAPAIPARPQRLSPAMLWDRLRDDEEDIVMLAPNTGTSNNSPRSVRWRCSHCSGLHGRDGRGAATARGPSSPIGRRRAPSPALRRARWPGSVP